MWYIIYIFNLIQFIKFVFWYWYMKSYNTSKSYGIIILERIWMIEGHSYINRLVYDLHVYYLYICTLAECPSPLFVLTNSINTTWPVVYARAYIQRARWYLCYSLRRIADWCVHYSLNSHKSAGVYCYKYIYA